MKNLKTMLELDQPEDYPRSSAVEVLHGLETSFLA
jgi:hypothetical protein